MLVTNSIKTRVGVMIIGATEKGICLFDFPFRHTIDKIKKRVVLHSGTPMEEGNHPLFELVEKQIEEYFKGERKDFSIPLDLFGTAFQLSVWNGLLQIPYGTTRSYEEQSINLGCKEAIRAVATANGENGIAIIVPCHRVIGKNGSLTGYGGGLPVKKRLLELERKYMGLANQSNLFL